MKKYWIMDLDRCIGCETCVIACKQENNLIPGALYRKVQKINPELFPHFPTIRVSISCNHCEKPACLKNCPAKAYKKVDGMILHDQENCIGCRYCTWVCPYGAPKFIEEKKRVGKCNLCQVRLKGGAEPSCVVACTTGALRLVDDLTQISDVNLIDTFDGFPKNKTRSKLRMVSRRRLRKG